MEKLDRRIFVHKKEGNVSILFSVNLLIEDLVFLLDMLSDKGYTKQLDLTKEEFNYYTNNRVELGMFWFDLDDREGIKELLVSPII
jgi:hypothetical protein